MDRTEYKERMDRIDDLLSKGNHEDALDLLDSINWQKLHNVNFLLGGAQRYEQIGKLEDAKDLLEIAHERSPVGRMIIYHLAIICAHLGDIEAASANYQKFIDIAPNDNIRYIIKYELFKAMGAEDAQLIYALEELRANELVEEWAFELAILYQKTGQIEKCLGLLDEIILWFGEGPYVERAYQIKRMYKPLSRDQEAKFNTIKQKETGVLEIHPGDIEIAGNEILGNTVRIPEIETDKFDTQNLQAEIRRNIEEIMRASELDEVSGNMEAIKELVEDIPHLKIDDTDDIEKRRQQTKKLNEQTKSKFLEYLSEEFDGQLSLIETGSEDADDQIEGQLTIEDITANWERTKRAAELAVAEAKESELMEYKREALIMAGEVLDKLKEEEQASEKEAEKEIEAESKKEPEAETVKEVEKQKTFTIPNVSAVGTQTGGFEIPVISAEDITGETKVLPHISELEPAPHALEEKEALDGETKVLPHISEAEEAEQALKDINQMLQDEIDKFSEENNIEAEAVPEEAQAEAEPAPVETQLEAEPTPEETQFEDIVTPEEPEEENKTYTTTTNLPMIDISDIGTEIQTNLSESQKEILSYFANIPGLEASLCKVISGAKDAMNSSPPIEKGHMIVQGRSRSGKTRLAQNLIKILQKETGKPVGNVGRIYADKLNEKDVKDIYEKVKGGALIIENAGVLNKETVIGLTLNMENDDVGTLLVLEDTRQNIDKLLKSDSRFAKKFSEKVSIPIMTIDELVGFGKVYAAEQGYSIDEMGVLALYDRINLTGEPGQPANISDVKDIIDEAVDASGKGTKFKGLFGLFSNKSEDESGMLILQERDFRED